MKKMMYLLMLVTSITEAAFAQDLQTKSDRTFDYPANYARRRFFIDLGKGNKLQIDLVSLEDLKPFSNMDSVIREFLSDITLLKDSLGDELLSKRIDYTTDTPGRKKIRIRQFPSSGSHFFIKDGDAAALKLEQDTVNFVGVLTYKRGNQKKTYTVTHRYRLSFFLNDLSDLEAYKDGSLTRKIKTLQQQIDSPWSSARGKSSSYLKTDPSISSIQPKGIIAGGNFLSFRISVDVQNYKQYFVPSFSLGAGLIISDSHFKRDIVLSWDPYFFFATNSQGQVRTYRNDFLTLTLGHGGVQNYQPRMESHLLAIVSFGYLINRSGEYFKPTTFRVGGGRLSLFAGKTKIEPGMYFNNFFKGVTPTIKLIQSF